jgi:hypothetical protein
MKTNKILLIIAIVVAVPALLFAGFAFRGYYETKQEKAASSVAKTFVADIASGNTNGAYALTGKALQAGQKSDEFNSTMADLKASSPKYEAAQVMRQGSQVFYVQRVTGLPTTKTGSDAGNFYLALSKEGGSWKVTTATVF